MTRSKPARKIRRVRVSDHAIVRYLQRVEKCDIRELTNGIVTPTLLDWIEKMGGTGTYPTGNGFRVTMKNFVIVTVGI